MSTLTRTGSIVLSFTLAVGILADGQSNPNRALCAACGAALISEAGSEFDADGLNSSAKVFHHYGIHSHVEAYLVCVYAVEKTGGGKNEMEIKSTVVDRISGMRTVGERFVFRRVSDASAEEVTQSIANMPGRMYYVFLRLCDEGHVAVDAQNPVAFWDYTEGLREVADAHRKKCQPDGAANGSQPFRSETNTTSSAAGYRR